MKLIDSLKQVINFLLTDFVLIWHNLEAVEKNFELVSLVGVLWVNAVQFVV